MKKYNRLMAVVGILAVALIVLARFLPDGQDEFDRIINRKTDRAAVGFAVWESENNLPLSDQELVELQERVKSQPELLTKLVYAHILSLDVIIDSVEVNEWVDYCRKQDLCGTEYWPAIMIYANEQLFHSTRVDEAIQAYEAIPPSSLVFLSPDQIKEPVAETVRQRLRQLKFGRELFWVIDSDPHRIGYEGCIASTLYRDFIFKVVPKGHWAKEYNISRVYFREGSEIPLAEIMEAVNKAGIFGSTAERWEGSKSPTILNLFKKNQQLFYLLIIKSK